MQILKNILITVTIVLGIYLAVFLSYILIPACIFLFVLYVVTQMNNTESSS